MNKKFLLFLILIIISILYLFNVEKTIQNKLSILNKSIQSSYIDTLTSIENIYNTYFNQLDYIEKLEESNKSYLHYKLLYEKNSNELKETYTNSTLLNSYTSELKLEQVKVLSYYTFKDNSRVIVNKTDLNSSKIYSLITLDGFSAGIMVGKDKSFIGYLNNNNKCNYSVYIGDENAPGITSGINENGNLLIKYVPIWKKISIGDEVITSSMDNIFPFGIKVGKVLKVKTEDTIQEIIVKPYAKTLGVRDYFLFEHN